MTGTWDDSGRFGRDRNWDVLPADEAPVDWTVDPGQGWIQGPLDLEFLRGRCLALSLAPGQMALLVRENSLQTVYLDGGHLLDIGPGPEQIAPACGLIFLAGNGALNLHWNSDRPLRIGREPGTALIGHCHLMVDGPQSFFDAFLRGPATIDPDFILRLVEQMVHGSLEEILADVCNDSHDPGPLEIQSRLTGLSPADVADELAACGLGCTNLAVYTAAPPMHEGLTAETVRETAGHHDRDGHN
jgi:hypothetical protein